MDLPDKTAIPIDMIRKSTTRENGTILGHVQSHKLRSAFQPIFSLAHKRVIGYEALVRVQDKKNNFIPPTKLFSNEKEEREVIFLDRLCRFIHLGNFKFLHDDLNWLFLNISPTVMHTGPSYGTYFHDLLDSYSFPPHRIVIEIVEHPIADQSLLSDTVNYYKHLGCLIAIDDFGAGHSNFERIWSLSPHIVKLDRSMIVRAAQQKNIRQLFPSIVSLLHQTGALVLVEGIENGEQALIAMDSDVDFVQGYYFAKPSTNLIDGLTSFFDFDSLFHEFKQLSNDQELLQKNSYDKYKKVLIRVVTTIQMGKPLEEACAPFLKEDAVERCYLLQTNGIQIGNTVSSKSSLSNEDLRYKPLEDANSADWFRRHYLKRAVMHPQQVQITRPYLSITGGQMCVTLSIMFSAQNGDSVLCCDLRL